MRTAAEEHRMAMVSALDTVERSPRATVADVMRHQGLCELRARKALQDLVAAGKIVKVGQHYVPAQRR